MVAQTLSIRGLYFLEHVHGVRCSWWFLWCRSMQCRMETLHAFRKNVDICARWCKSYTKCPNVYTTSRHGDSFCITGCFVRGNRWIHPTTWCMGILDVCFTVSLAKPLNKQVSYRRFESPCRSGVVTNDICLCCAGRPFCSNHDSVNNYRQISNISRTLVGNKIVDYSYVGEAARDRERTWVALYRGIFYGAITSEL